MTQTPEGSACKDAVLVGEARISCGIRGDHEVHLGHLGKDPVQWGGPIGATWTYPFEFPVERTRRSRTFSA